MKRLKEYFNKLIDSDMQRENVEWSNIWIDRVADKKTSGIFC